MEGNRIKAVGKNLDGGHARVVDGRGKIVLPGFVDLHNHLWQALIRGCAGDNELNGWLGRCVLPFYRNAPVTDWSHAFNADFARGNLRALDESKLRFVFSYNGTTNTALQAEIRRVKREVIDPNPLAHLQIGTHPSTGNYPSLEASEKLARELGVSLNVHLHESKADPATGRWTRCAAPAHCGRA